MEICKIYWKSKTIVKKAEKTNPHSENLELTKKLKKNKISTINVEKIRSPHGKKGETGYKYLSEWPKEKQIEILKTYYKFMFVRHPLERLLSAYRDKVTLCIT